MRPINLLLFAQLLAFGHLSAQASQPEAPLQGQSSAFTGPPEYTTARIAGDAPTIDGALDDAAWDQVECRPRDPGDRL